ncbi:CAP domain-containing protein [Pseudonocardia sp. RS11V-5]|uniref:RCC1 domain-containing protein n=1 Tax=Pseudonocardia terrae TaxID=2905831 RepID=UPI001E2C43BC|nr:CAP domain-containing protein [Pseudonocardia terrae]MCE3555738.1 CAP domain-containing protein [Pseudonocardia terrae]
MTCENADVPAAELAQADAEAAVLCLVNEERAANGRAPLTLNARLRVAARRQAHDAVLIKWWDGGGTHIHTNPITGSTPKSRIADTGYCGGNPVPTNENGYDAYYTGPPNPNTSAKAAVGWWISSSEHHRTMLDPSYRETGIAVVPGLVETAVASDNLGYVFVQTFGGCAEPEPFRDTRTWVWGLNRDGELGDGTTTDRHSPTVLEQLSGVTALSAGSHSLALVDDGEDLGVVWAWGPNWAGQVGDGSTTHRHEPVRIDLPRPTVAIAAGFSHSLALLDDGTVQTWGLQYQNPQSDDRPQPEPGPVAGLDRVTAITAGWAHSMALRTDGTVWTWGNNNAGQLGSGTKTADPVPRPVRFPADVGRITHISTGGFHSMAVDDTGRLWTWGSNAYGEIGDGMVNVPPAYHDRLRPFHVELEGPVTSVAGGIGVTLAVVDGTAWAWGDNQWGQLGDGTLTPRPTPDKVLGLADVVSVVGGACPFHCLAVDQRRQVWAWGNNIAGALGDGSTTDHHTPALVRRITSTVALASGHHHTLAAL